MAYISALLIRPLKKTLSQKKDLKISCHFIQNYRIKSNKVFKENANTKVNILISTWLHQHNTFHQTYFDEPLIYTLLIFYFNGCQRQMLWLSWIHFLLLFFPYPIFYRNQKEYHISSRKKDLLQRYRLIHLRKEAHT